MKTTTTKWARCPKCNTEFPVRALQTHLEAHAEATMLVDQARAEARQLANMKSIADGGWVVYPSEY